MRTSENGIAFIKAREGFAPVPMDDNGHLAWGHGHDQKPGDLPPRYVSLADADLLLRADLPEREAHVNALAPWANQNQFDALVSFTYNEGPGALATMLHHGQAEVPKQMPAWCYEHVNGVARRNEGLAARREKEVELYGS